MVLVEEALANIRSGRIHSSSEVVFYTMDKMLEVLAETRSLGAFADFVRRAVRARPTSALLVNVAREIVKTVLEHKEEPLDNILEYAKKKSLDLKARIQSAVETSSAIAEKRLESGDTILTMSYSLFVKRTLERALERGKEIKLVVAESRPGGEGVRLALEMVSAGCDTTLIVDSAVRFVMKNVDKVLLPSESITANGANVSKVGSSQVALAAHEARVRVYVVTTSLKFSPETFVGELVELPEADTSEIMSTLASKGLHDVRVRAPLFDVTPPEYIDAIITERGLMSPAFVVVSLRELYGWPPQPPPLEDMLQQLMV